MTDLILDALREALKYIATGLEEPLEKSGDEISANLTAAIAAREGELAGWRKMGDRPEWQHQPMRQFILIEGHKEHSDAKWMRRHVAMVWAERDGPQGYRRRDIIQALREGDMDDNGWTVAAWMPATFPPYPAWLLPSPPVSP